MGNLKDKKSEVVKRRYYGQVKASIHKFCFAHTLIMLLMNIRNDI